LLLDLFFYIIYRLLVGATIVD